MEAVIDVLKREGVSVVVVSADSVVSGDEGPCGTYWVLGEQGSPRLGVLLWSGEHVYVLRGNAICAGCSESTEPAPWYQVVAKGKRGGQTAKQAQNLAKARAAKRAKGRDVEKTCLAVAQRLETAANGGRRRATWWPPRRKPRARKG